MCVGCAALTRPWACGVRYGNKNNTALLSSFQANAWPKVPARPAAHFAGSVQRWESTRWTAESRCPRAASVDSTRLRLSCWVNSSTCAARAGPGSAGAGDPCIGSAPAWARAGNRWRDPSTTKRRQTARGCRQAARPLNRRAAPTNLSRAVENEVRPLRLQRLQPRREPVQVRLQKFHAVDQA
jgi:hypothetical protein